MRRHRVPRRVAVRVVQPLEVVNVQHHQGKRIALALRAPELQCQCLIEPSAVRKACETVRLRQLLKPELGAFEFVLDGLARVDGPGVDDEAHRPLAAIGHKQQTTLQRRSLNPLPKVKDSFPSRAEPGTYVRTIQQRTVVPMRLGSFGIAQRLYLVAAVLGLALIGVVVFAKLELDGMSGSAHTMEHVRVPKMQRIAQTELNVTRVSLQLRHDWISADNAPFRSNHTETRKPNHDHSHRPCDRAQRHGGGH